MQKAIRIMSKHSFKPTAVKTMNNQSASAVTFGIYDMRNANCKFCTYKILLKGISCLNIGISSDFQCWEFQEESGRSKHQRRSV